MIKTVEFMNLTLTLAGTKEKMALEKALGCSPLNHILPMMAGATEGEMDFSKMQIPSLPFMVTVLHTSAQKLNHGITVEKIYDLVDGYLEGEDASVFGLFAIVMEVLMTGKYLLSEEN